MSLPWLWKMHPGSGGAKLRDISKVTIRLAKRGCRNRRFFHIVVMQKNWDVYDQPIEQIGSYDPMKNERNEYLVAFNFERLRYWLGRGADISKPVQELLGLAGYLPVHPRTYMMAWRTRRTEFEKAEKEAEKVAKSN